MMTYDTNTGGCGCGGGGCDGKGGCGGGCASKAAPAAGPTDGFVRPRFFAGQLLTEDDLQAGVDYHLAKRRLSNRMLFGAGVAAGLEVTCDTCHPRQVVVHPGYGIDGMGNDLYLSCPTSLDVIALARQTEGDGCSTDRLGAVPGEMRRYSLYMHYTESLEEPVVPHLVDDGCASSMPLPEATRVREGVRFSLSCAPMGCGDQPPPDPRAARLAALVPNIGELRRVRDQAGRILERDDPNDLDRLAEAVGVAIASAGFEIDTTLGPFGGPLVYPHHALPERFDDVLNAETEEADAEGIDDAADAVVELITPWYVTWRALRTGIDVFLPAGDEMEAKAAVAEHIAAVEGLLIHWDRLPEEVRGRVEPSDGTVTQQHKLARRTALARLVSRLLDVFRDADGDIDALIDSLTNQPEYPEPWEVPYSADAAVALPHIFLDSSHLLRLWRDWLANAVGQMTCGGKHLAPSQCATYRALEGNLAFKVPERRPSVSLIEHLLLVTQRVHEAIGALLSDAACLAEVPPAPMGQRSGTLLARIAISDCQVHDVCVGGRPQIASPAARRYTDASIVEDEWRLCQVCCAPHLLATAVTDPSGTPPPHPGRARLDRLIDEAQAIQDGPPPPTLTPTGGESAGEDPGGDADVGDPEEDPPPPRPPVVGPTMPPPSRPSTPLDGPRPTASKPLSAARAPTSVPTWNANMRKAELIQVAETARLDVSRRDTKATIIAALEAFERKE